MNYKNLGNTDIKVSTICLGTMTWGEQNTELEAFEQMDFSLDQGVNRRRVRGVPKTGAAQRARQPERDRRVSRCFETGERRSAAHAGRARVRGDPPRPRRALGGVPKPKDVRSPHVILFES